MQTSKILLAICATLVFSQSVRGADSDAQARARQALEQQFKQPLSAPPPMATPPPAPTPRVEKQVSPAPAPTPLPSTPAEPGSARPADSEALAKAREAMHQKMGELSAQAPAPAQVRAEPPPKVIPPPMAETPSALGSPSEKGSDAAAIAKAREAMRQKMTELPTEEAEPGSANPATIAKAREAMYQKMQQLPPYTYNAGSPQGYGASAGTSLQFPPLQGPDLPISGDKVQRLHALLQQYKADQITPEQYQAERAKILAGP